MSRENRKYCDECGHFPFTKLRVDAPKCFKGHKLRFCMPRSPNDRYYGFYRDVLRECEDLKPITNKIIELPKQTYICRCHCGSTTWEIQVNRPDFTGITGFICAECDENWVLKEKPDCDEIKGV